jgi:hypothetical protein
VSDRARGEDREIDGTPVPQQSGAGVNLFGIPMSGLVEGEPDGELLFTDAAVTWQSAESVARVIVGSELFWSPSQRSGPELRSETQYRCTKVHI